MVKRKQTSDLRTGTINMSVHKYSSIPLLKSTASLHWGYDNVQPFFPPVEKLFKTEELESVTEYGIHFDNELVSVVSPTEIRTTTGETVEVHRKSTMILSPFNCMQNKYSSLILPTTQEQSQSTTEKVQSFNNAAYVGALISSVFSNTGFPNFPIVYGVLSGLSKVHKIDISDDYEELCERPWFSNSIGKHFDIELDNDTESPSVFKHTRTAKHRLELGDDIVLEDVTELEPTEQIPDIAPAELKHMFSENDGIDDNTSDSSSVSTSYLFSTHSCDCSELEMEDDEDDEDTDTPFAWAKFTNVPVQVTIMQKCEGTLYTLFTQFPDPTKHIAWISQVMFTLAYAQRNFSFIHNDLHGNNIMYVKTDLEHINYNCGGILYRVPTFGYIMKLIDFERSIISVKLNGMKEPKHFMSDHFSIDEEAGGQYNCEPFYNSKYPVVKPNPSFDLVRLATSMFWDIFPEGPDHAEYKEQYVFKLFMKWLTLPDNSSILFGKTNIKHDRYHGFNLYKAITRHCKDTAVPRKEVLELKVLYEVPTVPSGEYVHAIDF
jgi:hypothetical protein